MTDEITNETTLPNVLSELDPTAPATPEAPQGVTDPAVVDDLGAVDAPPLEVADDPTVAGTVGKVTMRAPKVSTKSHTVDGCRYVLTDGKVAVRPAHVDAFLQKGFTRS